MSALPKPLVLVNGNGKCEVGDASIRCVHYYSMFQLNAIPYCKIIVVPEEGSSWTKLYEILEGIEDDADVTLSFEFSGNFINEPSRSALEEPLSNKSVTVFLPLKTVTS